MFFSLYDDENVWSNIGSVIDTFHPRTNMDYGGSM